MKIILATGIYPPDIGGPATYVERLATELKHAGHNVAVITYGTQHVAGVQSVSSRIPIIRWWRYAQQLKEIAHDADVIYAFSSVSCGVPLILTGLKHPKKILRLGGDFFWERYTAMGGKQSLSQWYSTWTTWLWRRLMSGILRHFDHLVFSTVYQHQLYQKHYSSLPSSSVIENALAFDHVHPTTAHQAHEPFRLLFMGRFVGFKNLFNLVEAMTQLPDCVLTLVGTGPYKTAIQKRVEQLGLGEQIRFVEVQSGHDKVDIMQSHDLLVLPSLTEISPNVALEARSLGMPVLLTEHTGLSAALQQGMVIAPLRAVDDIVAAVTRVRADYNAIAATASEQLPGRSWSVVTDETVDLCNTLLVSH